MPGFLTHLLADNEIGWNDHYLDLIHDDPSRTLMGARQENWFYRSLSQSKERGATWRIVGNQIIFSRILENDAGALSGDNWNVSALLLSGMKPAC